MGILVQLAKVVAFGGSLGLVAATAYVVYDTLTDAANKVRKKS